MSSSMDLLRPNIQYLRRYAGSIAWGPFVTLSRNAILSSLTRIRVGQLKIVECDGHQTTCGGSARSSHGPNVELSVHKDAFWIRTLLFADMVRLRNIIYGGDSQSDLITRALLRVICLVRYLAII